MSEETPQLVIKEEAVLEKFEGDVLVERITLVNGEIINHEHFDVEGGNS